MSKAINQPVWSSGVRKRAGFSLADPRLGIKLMPPESRRCGVAVPEAVGEALVEAPRVSKFYCERNKAISALKTSLNADKEEVFYNI